VLDFASLGPVP
jgi:hypothetical protein